MGDVVTKEVIDRVVNDLRKDCQNQKYLYRFPSPNNGKNLVVYGSISPGTASTMAAKVWNGEAKVEDFDCMTEEDPMDYYRR